jgi:hypothetical protein
MQRVLLCGVATMTAALAVFTRPPERAYLRASRGVSDGTRTRDRLDHNQELYHLSYAHQATVGM